MWILVTGGAKRLGAEICIELAAKGHSVVVHYNHSKKDAEDVVSRCKALGVESASLHGDFNSIDDIKDFAKRFLQTFPHTNGLINNVGNYLTRPALKTSIEEWMSLFQTNLHTPFLLSQLLVPTLIENKGQIINIGVSGLLRHGADIYSTAYTLTKESLWILTRSLARELAPQGVQVNMVSPGMLDISIDLPNFIHKLPMQRPGYCSEVARVVSFLLDPSNSYITGQNIEVAGGFGLA